MTCDHCLGEIEKHDGLLHCIACGCWFVKSGELDPNHTACREAQRQSVPVAGQTYAEPEPFENPNVTPIPDEVVKGGRDDGGVPEGDAADPEDTSTPERRTRRRS